ncbi:4798_t:CDS:2, partial [Acaulospora morrowiae]
MAHLYFTSVEAGFWSLKHYVNWIIKNESGFPLWETCLTNFYDSSNWEVIVITRRLFVTLIALLTEFSVNQHPETKAPMEDLRIPYEQAYNGKYGKSIYKTIVYVQKEEEIFASASEKMRNNHSKKLRLLEMQPNPLTLDMPEAWYRINIWRTVDIAFSDIPYIYVIGGEKVGLTSSERKNRYRSLPNIGPIQRKAIGKKGDAYVRKIGSTSTDRVASEAGPKWQGMHSIKLMKESGLSLPRTLEDGFIHLADKVKFAEEKLRKLNVIGFVHAGAVLIRVNLDYPAGYVCRYTRGNPLEVYSDVKNFSKSLDVLIEIIYAKHLVLQTMKVVNDPVDNNSNVTRWKQQ